MYLEFGGITAFGINGILVNPPAGSLVNLIGLSIDGEGSGINGVRVANGVVTIINSQIFSFTAVVACGAVTAPQGVGVCVEGPAGTKVTIENSMIFDNGIGVINSPQAGANQVVIEHTLLNFNATANVQNDGAGAKTFFDADSLINSPVATLNTAGSFFTYGNNVMTGTVATMTPNALQ